MDISLDLDNLDSIVRITAVGINKDIFIPFNILDSFTGTGTGFFIDKDYILTCYHVIADSIDISINIQSIGKKKFNVELVSFCSECDVALLKLVDKLPDDLNLNIVKLGNSDKIKKGDSVIALGYPLGVDSLKLTKGTISGNKDIFFQTDTAINPGNSGGPLLILENNNISIIGINTQKIVSQNVDNTGFSLPIRIAKDIWLTDKHTLKKNIFDKKLPSIVNKPELYIKYYNLTNEYLKLNLVKEIDSGIIIKFILEKSPFYSVGLRVGDIIHKIDGYKIDNYGFLKTERSFDKISLEIYFMQLNLNDIINIEFVSLQDKNNPKLIKKNNIVLKNYELPIHEIYPVLRDSNKELATYKYEVLGGIVISKLTLNHVNLLDDINISALNYYNLLKYKIKKNRFKPIIFISNILQGSYCDKLEIFNIGDIIISVNDIEVDTIDTLLENINKTKINNLIQIKTHDDKKVILDINKIKKNEDSISNLYMYEPTNIYKLITNKININDIQEEESVEDNTESIVVIEKKNDLSNLNNLYMVFFLTYYFLFK